MDMANQKVDPIHSVKRDFQVQAAREAQIKNKLEAVIHAIDAAFCKCLFLDAIYARGLLLRRRSLEAEIILSN